MADNLEYTVEPRKTGKHWSRTLRTEKKVPAVVYGPKVKSFAITLLQKEVEKFDKSQYDNAIFVFKSADSNLNGLKVLKKDSTIHPVSRRPVHLDFFALDMTKSIRVFVEVRFDGRAVGVKEGGILNIVRRELEVECLPSDIPKFIATDVTELGIGYSLHASELVMPEGVKLITLANQTLCTVVSIEEEAARPAAVDATAATAAAPAEGAAAAAPAADDKKAGEKK